MIGKNYLATKKDLEAINEALRFVWHPKMKFVFQEKSKIANTAVISYDSKFIYIWTQKELKGIDKMQSGHPKYLFYKIPHALELKERWQYTWHADLWKNMEKFLPDQIKRENLFDIPRIGGGLLTPFVELQKKRGFKYNPYVTGESYLATIIHEFGHNYWNQHKLWWYSNKEKNIEYLTAAKNLYQKGGGNPNIPLHIPTKSEVGELFAFCTEYYASSIFWPTHRQALDIFGKYRLKELIREEKGKNLDKQDSVLEPSKNLHDFSLVFGKIIFECHPKKWPSFLTSPPYLGSHYGLGGPGGGDGRLGLHGWGGSPEGRHD